MSSEGESHYFLPHDKLHELVDLLKESNYKCIGPRVINGAIVYDIIDDVKHFPWGVRDQQSPGRYRLEHTDKKEAFSGWTSGSQSIKPLVFKPREVLWKASRDEAGKLRIDPVVEQAPLQAMIGVRACDLAGLAIQDKIFLQDKYVDEHYKKWRDNLFLIAVNCVTSTENCFCQSAIGGAKAKSGYDLEMTEINNGFVVSSGTKEGEKLILTLNLHDAAKEEVQLSNQLVNDACKTQQKKLPEGNIRNKLFSNLNHPQYDDIAKRCLSCTNCTMVCPTCFCHNEFEVPTLKGDESEHVREWDSCFTRGHSFLSHAVIRNSTKERYRQWITHKLGGWFDQFGMSGCVGCGRCITWCPVGIDITVESNILCNKDGEKEL